VLRQCRRWGQSTTPIMKWCRLTSGRRQRSDTRWLVRTRAREGGTPMSVTLNKGGNVSLSKQAPGLTAVIVGRPGRRIPAEELSYRARTRAGEGALGNRPARAVRRPHLHRDRYAASAAPPTGSVWSAAPRSRRQDHADRKSARSGPAGTPGSSVHRELRWAPPRPTRENPAKPPAAPGTSHTTARPPSVPAPAGASNRESSTRRSLPRSASYSTRRHVRSGPDSLPPRTPPSNRCHRGRCPSTVAPTSEPCE